MTTVIIPQKMSGTGTIHDIASQHHDRVIEFEDGNEYAVVLADYYGHAPYMADSEIEALGLLQEYADYSKVLIDRNGKYIDQDWFCNTYA